jgi:hypothetical protein
MCARAILCILGHKDMLVRGTMLDPLVLPCIYGRKLHTIDWDGEQEEVA